MHPESLWLIEANINWEILDMCFKYRFSYNNFLSLKIYLNSLYIWFLRKLGNAIANSLQFKCLHDRNRTNGFNMTRCLSCPQRKWKAGSFIYILKTFYTQKRHMCISFLLLAFLCVLGHVTESVNRERKLC